MLESIKTFFADEKVQAFAMGAVAGGLIAGGATYFATRGRSTVEAAASSVADAVDDAVDAAKDVKDDVVNKAQDVADDINPKSDDKTVD